MAGASEVHHPGVQVDGRVDHRRHAQRAAGRRTARAWRASPPGSRRRGRTRASRCAAAPCGWRRPYHGRPRPRWSAQAGDVRARSRRTSRRRRRVSSAAGCVPGGHADSLGAAEACAAAGCAASVCGDLALDREPGRARSRARRDRRPAEAAATSPSMNSRWVSVPTCSTPTTFPSTISGTPSSERTPLLPHQRVDHLDRRVVEIRDDHRLARRRHAAGEAAADRQTETALDLLLEALGRPGGERPAVVLDEQDGRRVRVAGCR